jgi:hypothetical protein
MLTLGLDERRRRLARRHRLARGSLVDSVEDATRSMVGLHATDPVTVYLSAWARVDGFTREDMDRALYTDRTLVKHLAMRRTLFVFPQATLPAAQAGASARVAANERRRVIQQIQTAGVHPDGARWLDDACELVLAALSDGRQDTMAEIRKDIPLLEGSVEFGVGKRWGGRVAIAPWVLTVLSAEGRVVRATNDGGWATSRPRWAAMEPWLGAPLDPPTEAEGVAELVRLWLRAFGPGTEADLKWWLGSTLALVRHALADVGAVEVDLDGRPGYLLPDDLEPTDPVEPWAALLPALDPTTMGWTERDWYLGPYKSQLFDTAGNAGPTIWWDGRIVGGWRQSESGEVVVQAAGGHRLRRPRRRGFRGGKAHELAGWQASPPPLPLPALREPAGSSGPPAALRWSSRPLGAVTKSFSERE